MVDREVRFDREKLMDDAFAGVDRLVDGRKNRERTYPSNIQAVWVFSGSGTVSSRLKINDAGVEQPEYMRWMDRDRIRAGVGIVREVTAATQLNEYLDRFGVPFDYRERMKLVTKADISKKGPFFVYNGVTKENAALRDVIEKGGPRLPEDKIVIIDDVRLPDGGREKIKHTGHQYQTFFDALEDPESPLFGITNVALVAHISDFVRHPFYAEKYNQDRIAKGLSPINFWAYGLRNRLGTEQILIAAELQRLVAYAGKDLAVEPVELNY